MQAMQDNATAMGQALTPPRTTILLPATRGFRERRVQAGMKMFISPDGKSVVHRFSRERSHHPQGLALVEKIRNAAFESIRGNALEGSKVYLGGTASAYKDMQHGANYDLMIAGLARCA